MNRRKYGIIELEINRKEKILMTTFEDYFKEHNLPLIYDDGDIDHKAGYNVGVASYDEFDEYKPILNVLSQINKSHPELVEQLEELTTYQIELVPSNREINISLYNNEINITNDNYYYKGFDVKKDNQVFGSSYYIKYREATDILAEQLDAHEKLSQWLDDSNKNDKNLNDLLHENQEELLKALEAEGMKTSSQTLLPIEHTYKRIGNMGDLKDIVATANLGKRIPPETVLEAMSPTRGELIRTPDDWLISCQDYEKDGERYVRTQILYPTDESPEQNRHTETAVTVYSMAYQMIPVNQFATEANKLWENFQKFKEICYQQEDKLNSKFQSLVNDDTALQMAIEELSVDEAQTL
ncbi:MAG: hypothetical protein D8H99_30800 [Streptococcus sp.]|jgi:hypothetical protein|nr:MAG: hypothetical protein D8H99_30800 [Streptococcus sp.]